MSLIDTLDAAGLTGRGGAAFSTAVKIRAAHEARADLIVNACDGEIGAAKDAWVVANHLDELAHGAALVAGGRRRTTVRYAAHRDSGTARRIAAAGLDLLEVPHRYVSSEETALISLAQGGLARPMTKRAPFVRGGRDSAGRRISPTVVLNAETVWRIAQVAQQGTEWFRSYGTPAEPGPRLVHVHGAVARPTIVETGAGVPVRDLLEAAGGMPAGSPGILLAGLGGGYLSASEARRARWSGEDLGPLGVPVGPGIVEVLDPGACPLRHVDSLLVHAGGESAGQCGPCMFGLPALATAWRHLVLRPDAAGLDDVRGRIGLLPNRGACRFPDGVARFTASALRVFDAHLREHATTGCRWEQRHGADRPGDARREA